MRGEVKFWRNLERKDLKHYTAVLLNFILTMRDTLQMIKENFSTAKDWGKKKVILAL